MIEGWMVTLGLALLAWVSREVINHFKTNQLMIRVGRLEIECEDATKELAKMSEALDRSYMNTDALYDKFVRQPDFDKSVANLESKLLAEMHHLRTDFGAMSELVKSKFKD